jgi:glutaredoxin-related protein
MRKIILAKSPHCGHCDDVKANLTRKQQEALASLVMHQVANLKEYPEMREGEPDLANVSAEEIGKQLSIWMKKLPGTIWDNRLPQ